MSLAAAFLVGIPFSRAMEHCDNLVLLHERSGTGTRGRRRVETSVNRAVVVIAIASWQAFVQDMTRYLLDRSMPKSTDPNHGLARLIQGQVFGALDKYSTPNAENTRQLLRMVGFDPRPHWTWMSGPPGRQVTMRPIDVDTRLRQWLAVRHAIAHGDEKLPELDVLEAVRRNSFSSVDGPTVRLTDAKQCMAFVRKLAQVTMDGLEDA